MADATVMQSLFGVDPTTYQMAQQARQDAQAMEFAQLTPAQQAQYGGFRGGQMLGNVGANLLGVQDPMLQKASLARQLAEGRDFTTPKGLEEYGAALQAAGLNDLAMMSYGQAQKLRESQATIVGKTREHLSTMGKLQSERDRLIAANPQDPRIAEYNKAIAAEGSSKTPQIGLDVKMLDVALGRRTNFIKENDAIITQGAAINQALTLAKTDSAFGEAALENSLAQAFGGDKQKSKQEVARLLNTGSVDERFVNSVQKFATGKISDMTQQDRINVLEAVKGNLQRTYNKRRDSAIKSASGVKDLAGQEDYMAPTFDEMVSGGGAYAGRPAMSVGTTGTSQKYGTYTVLAVDAAGQPTKIKDGSGVTRDLAK